MRSLDWFPLLTGPGAMDATGGRKLLGTTALSFAELLVRESAQNSWDARVRDSDQSLHYGIRLRTLDAASTQLLRTRVLTGDIDELGLRPKHPEVPVLEISDRGTVGLNGPVRNDIHVPSKANRNFIDLVLNLGAPRDNDMGGGTYGFGKTASYVASSTGTIVIWSRTVHEGRLEDRFIASAMAEGFHREGRAYTGRHWWGRRIDDRVVEPIQGVEAAELGRALFERHFEKDETGTSILVLDPSAEQRLTGDELAADLEYAIALNLWPKLLQGQPQSRAMQIDLVDHGHETPLQPLDPLWSAYGDCLRAIRAVQDKEEPGNPLVKVVPIQSLRPRVLIGHLALMKRLKEADRAESEHHVCLMRNEAELVVKYQSFPALDDGVLEWVGVFKPTAANDDAFAQAEPPAHDDWVVPKGRERSQTLVRTARRRIKEEVDSFLRPVQVRTPESAAHSTAALADTLADIAGGQSEGRVVPVSTGKSGGPSRARARNGRVEVTNVRTEHRRNGRTLYVDVDVEVNAGHVLVRPRLGVAIEGGVDSEDVPVYIQGWMVDGDFVDDEQVRVGRNTRLQLILDVAGDFAVDLRFSVDRGAA